MIKKIIKKDLKNISKSKLLIIFFIAIVIVPSLYSIVNIVAFWDPYNNLDQMNVGIVNYDDGEIGRIVINK
ncbi:YhgE/Pip domain-containing protein [Methanobrevibacter filiformis]|uniref:Uncharacterized protein n=1 Tax=Methanobrevibacter filiformis TaxID=55758 RepID=A0A166AF31_9EURY|nr:hypothetical protein [Methanobrevibacter filiformis]KZX11949.1 hypothetical protein MBFIL_12870 [Methanobrevibacter filiformis]